MKKLLFMAVWAIAFACQKDDLDTFGVNDKNQIILDLDHRVGAQTLVLNDTKYTNASKEDFTVSTFNYFISNIILKNESGENFISNDYFLIKESETNSQQPILTNVPAGNYSEISFIIGVDSLKSTSAVDQRTGVLDPAAYGNDNMYWSWNSGYIFLKLEGISSKAPLNSAGLNKFQYHIGGFGGRSSVTTNNLRKITLKLPQQITVRKNISPSIHFIVDIQKIFGTSNLISTEPVIMNPSNGKKIADNYQSMFSIDHVHN
ncbi:MbnP family protein [Aquirufa sp. ROCK-SH2]